MHRNGRRRPERGYGRRMNLNITAKQSSVAAEFEARAATLRRVAEEMRQPDDREELLRIAAVYEEDAERLRRASPSAGS